MKNIIRITALLFAFMLMFSACGKKPNVNNEEKKNEVKQEEVINNEQKEEKQEEKQEEKEDEKEEKISDKDVKSDTGMFLGQDDSNFLVIFSASTNKDMYYKIGTGVDFSEIEIGEAVEYKYTVSETDEKTIVSIKAKK